MQQAKKDALVLSKYFVSLPHPAKTTLMVLAVSFLFGILFGIAKSHPLDPFEIFAGGIDGLFLLAFPALLSSSCLFLMRRKAIFRRSVFLGLITAVLYGAFYFASFALSGVWPSAYNLVFVGFGVAFVLWYFMLLLAFDFRRSAFVFATMQMVFFAVFFLARGGFAAETGFQDLLVKIYLASFIFLAGLYALFYFVSAPMKKNLGVSSLDALSMFLSQWLYGEKDLEETFEELGEEVETLVWVAQFSGRKNHALFVVPYIHYGPFGNLGGSEFTWMISDALGGAEGHGRAKRNVFVFHGTATHDFNPVSSSEIGKVVGACNRAIAKLRPAAAKIQFSSCRVGTVRAQAYRINDSAFIAYTRAPRTTEDVNLGLGLALMEKGKKHCSSVAVVDEHNAETGDISSVEVGSPIGFEMLDATDRLFEGRGKQEKFLFGCSQCGLPIDTVGRNGLRLALFARGKDLHALLLADSNSIVPDFRDSLNELLEGLGRENGFSCKGEVMTTDTHQINSVRGVLHPLGVDHRGDVMMAVRNLFNDAKSRLELVHFDSAEERFRIKVFGTGQSAEIASTINAAVAILRFALPLILLASAVLLLWALGKI
jgi:putative membrane protein